MTALRTSYKLIVFSMYSKSPKATAADPLPIKPKSLKSSWSLLPKEQILTPKGIMTAT